MRVPKNLLKRWKITEDAFERARAEIIKNLEDLSEQGAFDSLDKNLVDAVFDLILEGDPRDEKYGF